MNGDGKEIPAKTLWDWLELLIVPLVLAVGAWLIEGSRKRTEFRIEADRQQQKVLEDYFSCVMDLLIEQDLGKHQASPLARSIARTRTLAALRSLDGGRKAQLLQFLYESGLVSANPIVQLNGADLRNAMLDEVVLQGAEMRGVYFKNASFKNASVAEADLRGSDFSGVDFTGANLEGANFTQADLSDAKVSAEALAKATTRQAILPRVLGSLEND